MKKLSCLSLIVLLLVFGCGKSEDKPEEKVEEALAITDIQANATLTKGQLINVKVITNKPASTLDRFDYEFSNKAGVIFSANNKETAQIAIPTKDVVSTASNFTLKVVFRSGDKRAEKSIPITVEYPTWGLARLDDEKSAIEEGEISNGTSKLNVLVGDYPPSFNVSPITELRYMNAYNADYFSYFFYNNKLVGGSKFSLYNYQSNGQYMAYSIFKNYVANLEVNYGVGTLVTKWNISDADKARYYALEASYGLAITNRALEVSWYTSNTAFTVNAAIQVVNAQKFATITTVKSNKY